MTRRLWPLGLAIVFVASLVNGQLVKYGVGGLVRELMRFLILAGIVLFIAGIVQVVRKK